ncbi:MAG: helix-turn-helix domain-containing protein [Gammaproteobacteria bacterium]
MMTIKLLTPQQIKLQLAERAKQRRLEQNISRKTLAAKSGVPESTIKRFETTGNISLDALIHIAMVLDCLNEFEQLFEMKPPASLYQPAPAERQRGRK